ncbi:MAG TPA: carbon-nitrogen hydrolase [Nevskiaceae bacterium]
MTASRIVRVGLVQQACGDDRTANLAASERGIREAVRRGARLVALQELHASRYFCQHEDPAAFDLAEPIPGPSTERLGALAAELGIVLIASLFEKRAAGLYHNTAVVFDRSARIAGRYRKTHVPDDPGYYEKFYFAPGDLGIHPIDTSLGRLGVLVCWDQWYPEAARLMALAGAEMLVYPTAIGWNPEDDDAERGRQRDAWILVQRGHAVANGLPLLAINRVGFEPDPTGHSAGAQFWGSSFIAGPQGELLASAAPDAAEVLVADVDLARSEAVRRWWPFLRDRRIELYGDLALRYRDRSPE